MQRDDLRGEAEAVRDLLQKQRLFAERIDRQKQVAPVVKCEGEHAVETIEHAFTPLTPPRQQHFGIALGGKAVAEADQLVPQRAVIVDLAVEDDAQTERRHRLRGARIEIDDGKPAVGEQDAGLMIVPGALAVRAAMRQRADRRAGRDVGWRNGRDMAKPKMPHILAVDPHQA